MIPINPEWKLSTTPVLYETAHAFMETRVAAIINKQANPLIWLLEHPPLITAGTSAKVEDLLDTSTLPVYETGRGGQYTYHGPGQCVGYFMLDLKAMKPDIKHFVWWLEEIIITTLKHYNITGLRREGRVGIWVINQQTGKENKIAAIGIRVKKWVTSHGIAINVAPDLDHFNYINPCGITQYGVTSMAQELGHAVAMQAFQNMLQNNVTAALHAYS